MLKTLVISATCVWIGFSAFIYFWQAKLVFQPTRTLAGNPGERGYHYEDVMLETSDGIAIHAWHVTQTGAEITVLFFHGNAGTIADRPLTLARLHDIGANIFMADYRGYGRSGGSPDELGTYADANAAWT